MSEENKQSDPNEALADEWAAALDEQEDVEGWQDPKNGQIR